MNISTLNIKIKIALHSWGYIFILLTLLIISIIVNKILVTKYSILGLITLEIVRILFSDRKYLIAIQQDEFTITITYLNRMLVKKEVSIKKQGLDILDTKEVNWWYGRLDLLDFSNGQKKLTFNCIDSKLKQSLNSL